MMDRCVSLAARLVATHGDGAQPAARNRLSLELDAAGRPAGPESNPCRLPTHTRTRSNGHAVSTTARRLQYVGRSHGPLH